MSSINVSTDYFTHPKTKRLIVLLGKGSEVLPVKLWTAVGKYHYEDGRLIGYSAQDIESLVDWWGSPGAMVDAMMKLNFIEKDKDGVFVIHEWLEYNGHIAAYLKRGRALTKARLQKVSGPNDTVDDTVQQRHVNDAVERHVKPTVPPVQYVARQSKPDVKKPVAQESHETAKRPETAIPASTPRSPIKLALPDIDVVLGAMEAARRYGMAKEYVTRVWDWVIKTHPNLNDLYARRVLATCLDACDKSRDGFKFDRDKPSWVIACLKNHDVNAPNHTAPKWLDNKDLSMLLIKAKPISPDERQNRAMAFGYFV